MGVYIKGMTLPKDCVSCDLCDNDGYCYALYGDSLWDVLPDGAVYFPDGWKYVGCPLVEVPEPHGRLIDADRTEKLLQQAKDKVVENGEILRSFAVGFAIGLIAKEPTVIEGSEDDEKHDD